MVEPTENKDLTKEKKEGEKSEETKIETNWFDVAQTFDDLNIKEELLRGIYGMFIYIKYIPFFYLLTR